METTNKLELAIIELIRRERFFAELLMRMKREFDAEKIDTLCVEIMPEGVTLRVNPYFIEQFTVVEAAELIKHECEHIMRSHFDREKTMEPELHKGDQVSSIFDYLGKLGTKQLLNMAEDYAINENLPRLPKTFQIYDKEGKPVLDPKTQLPAAFRPCTVDQLQTNFPKKNIKRKQSMEYYYNILKELKQEQQQQNQGQGNQGGGKIVKNDDGSYNVTVDEHSELEKALEQIDPEVAKEIVKNLANDAFEALPDNMKGRVSADILMALELLNKKTIDWRKQLRQFRESCASVVQEETRRRRNRRYGLAFPGRRMKPILHIVTAMDTSGSIYCNPEYLNQFLAEINAMHRLGIDITVVECDASVKQVYKFDPKIKMKTKGGGGTEFNPVFKLLNSKKFSKEWGKPDGLIFLTDGENFDTMEVKKPKYRVLWALLPGHRVSYDWGTKCYMEVDRNGKRAI